MPSSTGPHASSYGIGPTKLVNMAPLNYAFLLSGPVTTLTARRICQPDPSARYKDALAPATFSTALSISFFVLRSPARPSGSTFPCRPVVPTERYEAANEEKCLSATAGFDSLDTLAALSRHPSTCGSTIGNDAGGASDSPGSSVTWSRNGIRCRTTAILPQPSQRINHTSLFLHVIDNAASARRLATSLLPHPSPISTAGVGRGWGTPGPAYVALRRGQQRKYRMRCPCQAGTGPE